jgi:hypothetical protein
MKHTLSLFALIIFLLVAFGSEESNKRNSNSNTGNSSSGKNVGTQRQEPCYGSENCIQQVRNNFQNSGKQILGEQYLGRGKFGITFLDPSRGEAYNADVSTDCNCNVSNVRVSVVQ